MAAMTDGETLPTTLPRVDPKVVFRTLATGLRAEVRSILEAESARGDVRWSDEGIELEAGGSWNLAVWNVDDSDMLFIACSQGRGERWLVQVAPLRAGWSPRTLEWPGDGFGSELRKAVATLRT
jgi:hypothetical protein